MFNDKTLDITLEEGASLAYSLKLESEVEVCVPHPLTGEDTNCHTVTNPTNLLGVTFEGTIIPEFGTAAIATFTMTIEGDGSTGIVVMSLTEANVQGVADLVRDNSPLNRNPRLRDVGFYTITHSIGAEQTRLMEGQVSMSLGA